MILFDTNTDLKNKDAFVQSQEKGRDQESINKAPHLTQDTKAHKDLEFKFMSLTADT